MWFELEFIINELYIVSILLKNMHLQVLVFTLSSGTRWFQKGKFVYWFELCCLHKLIAQGSIFIRFLGLIKLQVNVKFRRLFTSMLIFLFFKVAISDNLALFILFFSFFFFRLSLQYHPDKNKAKGAQEKFSQINNGI